MPDRPDPDAPPPVAPTPTRRVPLRRAEPAAPAPVAVAPLRAVAGAALAVAAVSLGIGALLLVDDGPAVAPAVAAPAAAADPLAEPAAEPTAEPAVEPEPTRVPAARRPLTVLNNSRTTGLAAREAADLRAAGWEVAVVGNLRGRTRTSTVYYDAGQRAAAERLARAHDVPRVLPRRDGLPGRGLTLVVTRDRG